MKFRLPKLLPWAYVYSIASNGTTRLCNQCLRWKRSLGVKSWTNTGVYSGLLSSSSIRGEYVSGISLLGDKVVAIVRLVLSTWTLLIAEWWDLLTLEECLLRYALYCWRASTNPSVSSLRDLKTCLESHGWERTSLKASIWTFNPSADRRGFLIFLET